MVSGDRQDGGSGERRVVLFYACSGGSNVAEVADRAARELAARGHGNMFCLAGVAAGIDWMIDKARSADLNVLIEGCDVDCARTVFNNMGVNDVVSVRVTDLGIEKVAGARATDEQVEQVVARVASMIQ